ncbi:NAD-dependent epimerase/dehydratase family protein [Thiorhodovibrio litoralis]|uniref:NAD-dependent epimerase/dehydratase family protein n=1 Tax=Thiorhodovibrio litoralis TaxID=2952932 RepID=UPI002B259777|nr:NAD(P)-dependent oxidoreductase [Thiorhodovibrio litoralis]WPL10441.1 UDP-glucose 4-epimerase [Thiorhodovibrio litoralis]
MTQKRALITGATGFVGSHLVKHLLTKGWDVCVIARPTSSLDQLLSVQERLVVHKFDGNIATMHNIMRQSNPDVVFHLASLYLSKHQPCDIPQLIDSNLLFGTQLIEAMSIEGVRYLVNTGTSWQHFENREYSPVNLYAATKEAFEAILRYYIEARGMCAITLKLFDTYGPDDPRPKLINYINSLATGNQRLAMSLGKQIIDMVHVDDVANAFLISGERLLGGSVIDHERYAVSSGQPMSLREVTALFEQLLGHSLPIDWGERPYRKREVMMPWSSGDTLPNWTPSISLLKGLAALVETTAHHAHTENASAATSSKTNVCT